MFRHHDDAPPDSTVYQLRQSLISIGDDYWVQNQAGQRVFHVDGKAVRLRETLILQDGNTRAELYKIQTKMLHVRDTMEIENAAGARVALVKKHLVTPIKERYDVNFEHADDWKVVGNIVDHEYEIDGPAGKVAQVSKKGLRAADTYGISVAPNQDDALIIAIVIVVDSMSHPHK